MSRMSAGLLILVIILLVYIIMNLSNKNETFPKDECEHDVTPTNEHFNYLKFIPRYPNFITDGTTLSFS